MSDPDEAADGGGGSEQSLGITHSKAHETGDWYAEVVRKAKLASYGPEGMGGFIVTRPRGYALWEHLKGHLDDAFKRTGVDNAYFPVFIPESYLEREKEVVDGFDPEVAWVTQGGYDELDERLAVRPTSESIIAPYMSQWVRSHRDLPMRLNQWCGVVRWEATETTPFFRTKEFLWQEGHTAHADEAGAWEETLTRLDQYARLYEDVLAMPVLRGAKPEHDTFPGAHTTTTVEALMPDGKSVQGGTSHYLGTTFADAFDITYTDRDERDRTAHTTSWGVSWRALGATIMTHSDDQGLVAPPAIAPEQVVVVPIWGSGDRDEVVAYAREVGDALSDDGVRVEVDDRDERTPGFKFNEWELRGVPLRLEIGPDEVGDRTVTAVHRPDSHRVVVDRDRVVPGVHEQLDEIHATLYAAAAERLDEHVHAATGRDEVLAALGRHGGYVRAPWCGDEDCEAAIKDEIAAEIVAVPLADDRDGDVPGRPVRDDRSGDCAVCGAPGGLTAYYARTY